MKRKLDRFWDVVKHKKNVVGCSSSLMPLIVDGEVVNGVKVFRVYVSKKIPLRELSPDDIIPDEIEGIRVDVVEVGEVKAQGGLANQA
jgi:hypothetical protein